MQSLRVAAMLAKKVSVAAGLAPPPWFLLRVHKEEKQQLSCWSTEPAILIKRVQRVLVHGNATWQLARPHQAFRQPQL